MQIKLRKSAEWIVHAHTYFRHLRFRTSRARHERIIRVFIYSGSNEAQQTKFCVPLQNLQKERCSGIKLLCVFPKMTKLMLGAAERSELERCTAARETEPGRRGNS